MGVKIAGLKHQDKSYQNNEIQKPWKSYIATFIHNKLGYLPYYKLIQNDMPKFKDTFYTNLLNTWS